MLLGAYRRRLRRVLAVPAWWPVVAVLLVQLAVLLHNSVNQYRTFNLSIDHGIFHQAWFQIAHGHLDAYNSVQGLPFWRDHGEFIMWPLALLYWLNRNDGLTLLFIQDLSFVVGLGVAVNWFVGIARKRAVSTPVLVAGVVVLLVLAVANPWLYKTANEDFHFEATGAALILLTGRDLWAGRYRRAVLWGALALAAGDVVGTYAVAMGAALAVSVPGRRRAGAVLALAGGAWVVFLSALHANVGSQIATFGYLAGAAPLARGVRGLAEIARGVAFHPHRPVHRLGMAAQALLDNVRPVGVVAFLDPLMVIPVLAVLLTNGLSNDDAFIAPGFQNAPVYLFAPLGVALLFVRLAGDRRWRTVIAAVAVVAVVASSLPFDINAFRQHKDVPFTVGLVDAQQLRQVRAMTPTQAEVISTFGVVGRFGGRRWVYPLEVPGQVVPLPARTVELVLAPGAGNQTLPAASLAGLEALVVQLHGRQIFAGPTVRAYRFTPPPGVTSLRVP